MDNEPLLEITFGQGGTDTHHLGAGWSGDEPGYRWAIGPRSELWLDNPGADAGYVLEIVISPFVRPPEVPVQRLVVQVRGIEVGRFDLTGPTTLGFRIPAGLLGGQGPVRVVFEHPDAARPSELGHARDGRALAVSFYQARLYRIEGDGPLVRIEGGEGVAAADIGQLTGTPAAQFMLRFESFGDNCEFGLVQRRCGAEPLGLLRFSNLELPQLLRGLDNRFEGLGEVNSLELSLDQGNPPEYVLRDRGYNLVFHTFLNAGTAREEELLAQQSGRMQFLRRKLLEDLANGEKIFVVKRNVLLTEHEMLPLRMALQRYGANTLLYVVPSADHSPGTVVQVAPGLLCGYIDRLAPHENAHELSLAVWLRLCINAAKLTAKDARPGALG